MNVIQRICDKYPIEYNLMPDLRTRSVTLRFSRDIPMELQDKIADGLELLGVLVEDRGMAVSLSAVQDREDTYSLSASGKEFYFSTFTGIPFYGYDISEAIIWTIYILASNKPWLDPYQGKSISCRCFSARQQAAAMQISSSVLRQYQGDFSEDQLLEVFRDLRLRVRPFAMQAPRFSAQPIEESVFDKCKGRTIEASLSEIAQRLFGPLDFNQELEAYSKMIRDSKAYRNTLEEAVQKLVETAYQMPIMAVSHLFTEMGTLIDEIEPINATIYRQLLQETVRFSLNAASLKQCFEEIDKAYLKGLLAELEIAFLREVCDKAHTAIYREFSDAKRGIIKLRNALGRFCFVSPDTFEMGADAGMLSWKQLANLADRDVYSKNISWTPDSLDSLQSVLMGTYSPHLWLCSQKLRNQAEAASIADVLITQAVPVMDDRLVWAIWVDL